MAIRTKRVVARSGMSASVPALMIGEIGWDVDLKRFRVGDDTTSPPYLMTNKSLGIFEYNFITYVQYPEIRMLPRGTVDGVDISELNAANGLVTRRGPNLWAHRSIVTNDPQYVKITNGNGVSGNPTIDFSDDFKYELSQFLKTVAVDDITIHGNGRPESPLYAHVANNSERGVVRLATSQETINGVDPTIAVTPFGLSARTATTERTGLVELATSQETIDGVSGERSITPAGLSARTATTVRTGITRIATKPEVDAGVEDFAYLTPFKFRQWLLENPQGSMTGAVLQSELFNQWRAGGLHSVTLSTAGREAFIFWGEKENAEAGGFIFPRAATGSGPWYYPTRFESNSYYGDIPMEYITGSFPYPPIFSPPEGDWIPGAIPNYKTWNGGFLRPVGVIFKRNNQWYGKTGDVITPMGADDGVIRFTSTPYGWFKIWSATLLK